MLTCTPVSPFSWDFRVRGAAAGTASLTMDFMSEQGGLSLQTRFDIRKHGPLSGHWTLEHRGKIVGEARKLNAFSRDFDLRVGETSLGLSPQSAFTRAFDLHRRRRIAGTIRPVNWFTRRAVVDCGPDVPDLAQLFAFWLAVVTWRRAARQSAH